MNTCRVGRAAAVAICSIAVLVFSSGCAGMVAGMYESDAQELVDQDDYAGSVALLYEGVQRRPGNVDLRSKFYDFRDRAFAYFINEGNRAFQKRKYYAAFQAYSRARALPEVYQDITTEERDARHIIEKAATLRAHIAPHRASNRIVPALDLAVELTALCTDCPNPEVASSAIDEAIATLGGQGDQAMQDRRWGAAIEAYRPLAKHALAGFPEKLLEAERKEKGFQLLAQAREAAAAADDVGAIRTGLDARQVIPEEPEATTFVDERKDFLYQTTKAAVVTALRRAQYDDAVTALERVLPVLPNRPDLPPLLDQARKRRAQTRLRTGARFESRQDFSAAANAYLGALEDDSSLVAAQRRIDTMKKRWAKSLISGAERAATKKLFGVAWLNLAAGRRFAPEDAGLLERQRAALAALGENTRLCIAFWKVENLSFNSSGVARLVTNTRRHLREKWGGRIELIGAEDAREMRYRAALMKDLAVMTKRAAQEPDNPMPDFEIELTIVELDVKDEQKPMIKSATYEVARQVPNAQYQVFAQELASLRQARAGILQNKSVARAGMWGNALNTVWSAAQKQNNVAELFGRAAATNLSQSLSMGNDINAIDRRIAELEGAMVEMGTTSTVTDQKTARFASTLHRRTATAKVTMAIRDRRLDEPLFEKNFEARSEKEDITTMGNPDAGVAPDPLELPSQAEMAGAVLDTVSRDLHEKIDAAVRLRGDALLKLASASEAAQDFDTATELYGQFHSGPYFHGDPAGAAACEDYFRRRLEFLAPAVATVDEDTLGIQPKSANAQ